MDKSLEHIVRQALEDARARGQDYISQTWLAVGAVREARPDMTASEVLSVVNLVRRS